MKKGEMISSPENVFFGDLVPMLDKVPSAVSQKQ